MIEKRRRASRRTAASCGCLRVEDAQRIAFEPALRVVRQFGGVRPEVGQQRFAIRAAGRRASPIELSLSVASRECRSARSSACASCDDLDVGLGTREAEALDAELVGLPIAPGLRPLVAEERPDVEEPLRPLREQVVLEHRAHDRRGPLRAQRHAAAALVGERVHLFLDDVGRLADAAHEEFGRLEHRRADLAVAEAGREIAAVGFEAVPAGGFGRKDIVGSARRADRVHGRRVAFAARTRLPALVSTLNSVHGPAGSLRTRVIDRDGRLS